MRQTFKVEKFRMGKGREFIEEGGYYTTVKGLAIVGKKDHWSLLHIPSCRLFGMDAKKLEDFNLILSELVKLDLNWDVPIEEISRNKILYISAVKSAIVKSHLEGEFSRFMRYHS